MKKIIYSCLTLLICYANVYAQNKSQRVPVIFDTDMGPDYDDAGAITLLHAFADEGKATILATMASTKHANVAATLDVFNTYFKRPDIPVGVPKGWAQDIKDFQHWTDSITANYPHAISNNDDAADAVKLYRQILSKQPDNSVTIITVGFLTNLYGLLQSGADAYSPLSGKLLVKQKVKQLVSMAGKFPSGSEFNVIKHAEASKYVFENWPKPVIFSGFEIGQKIKTGLPLINNEDIQNSPVKDVFRIAIPLDKQDADGRMSWDETAVLVAIAGYQDYYTLHPGKIVVDGTTGDNSWVDDKKGTHFYLVEKVAPAIVQKRINDLMMHQPKR
ncbi:MAG: nucleoside hydrolase [Agriterribacter sp.]